MMMIIIIEVCLVMGRFRWKWDAMSVQIFTWMQNMLFALNLKLIKINAFDKIAFFSCFSLSAAFQSVVWIQLNVSQLPKFSSW